MTVEAPPRPDRASEELQALMEEARRRARRRRFGYAAGAVALLLAVAAAFLLGGGDDSDQRPNERNARPTAAAKHPDLLFVRAALDSREGSVLREAILEIDLTSGKVERLRLPFNCGDTPFCLISTGGDLVISSAGRTIAYDPGARGRHQAARIGAGWITVPSTHDGRVWLGILARGKRGGPHRRGLSAVREVDLDGEVVQSMRPPEGEWPVGAVASGLLFQEGNGLRLWSREKRKFTMRIPGAYPADTTDSLVASCGDGCPRTLLTDTSTGETTRIAPPDGYRWVGGYDGAFSPDGSYLALPIAPVEKGLRSSRTLAVIDVRTRDVRVIPGSAEVEPVYGAMAWSSEGNRLFFVADDRTVVSYRVGSDGLTTHERFDADDLIFQMVSVSRRD